MINDDNNFEVEIKNEEKSNEGKSIEQNSISDNYSDNNDEDNNNMNINDSLNIYEKKNYKKDTNLLGSEEIFINQRKEIEIMKKKK